MAKTYVGIGQRVRSTRAPTRDSVRKPQSLRARFEDQPERLGNFYSWVAEVGEKSVGRKSSDPMHTTNNLVSGYLVTFRSNYSVSILRNYKVLYNNRIKVGRYIAHGPMGVNNNNVLY